MTKMQDEATVMSIQTSIDETMGDMLIRIPHSKTSLGDETLPNPEHLGPSWVQYWVLALWGNKSDVGIPIWCDFDVAPLHPANSF